jgi:hypothetical protein
LEGGLGENLLSRRFPPITQYLNNNLSIIRMNWKKVTLEKLNRQVSIKHRTRQTGFNTQPAL